MNKELQTKIKEAKGACEIAAESLENTLEFLRNSVERASQVEVFKGELPEAKPEVFEWEYRVDGILLQELPFPDLQQWLDRKGKYRWELVQMRRAAGDLSQAIFKRRRRA